MYFSIPSIVSQKNSESQITETSVDTKPSNKDPKDLIIASLYHKKLLIDSELNQQISFDIFRNQLIYIFTLLVTVVTTVLFISYPSDLFPKWYVAIVITMFLTRIIDYTQKKGHFFLIDFCYTAGLQIIFFLGCRFQSIHLATRTFGFGAGILGWSTILLSNGLTLHRLDEFCSLWIHTVPSLLAYSLRWINKESVIYYERAGLEFSSEHMLQYYIACYAPYIVWATGYYIIITKAFRHLTVEGEYRTLIRLIVEEVPSITKILDIFGTKNRAETFMLCHCLYFTLVTLVGYLCFFNRILHTICLIIIISSPILQGGRMLAKDIAKPYLTRLEKINSLLINLG